MLNNPVQGDKDSLFQQAVESAHLSRREFFGFFVLGGLVSLLSKKVHAEQKPKEAMFWKRLD